MNMAEYRRLSSLQNMDLSREHLLNLWTTCNWRDINWVNSFDSFWTKANEQGGYGALS